MGNFLLGLFGNLLAAEIGAWCRGLAQKIVCATARKLPEKLQPRMLEEWSALLEDIPGDLSKLWMAISLYRKRSVLADECEKLIDEPFPSRLVFRLTKRFVDMMVAIGGLMMMFPLFLLVAFLIKADSPGPVFYRQVRVGLRGRLFSIWKFRSTVQDPERAEPRWAQADDPCISRVGWWLRKTRIDEFPQLVNVLRGEMSLVGPRPQRPMLAKYMQESIPYYGLRHAVRPGITGWTQVKLPGGFSAEDAHMKLQYDLYYVKRLSFWFDIKILVETVRDMFIR